MRYLVDPRPKIPVQVSPSMNTFWSMWSKQPQTLTQTIILVKV